MKRSISSSLLLVAALACTNVARADLVAAWNLNGTPGTQTSSPVTATASGVTGVSLTEGAGLTPNAGANSMNAAGWNDLGPNDYFQFGFTNATGAAIILDALYLGTRSSGTGPGFINVSYSTNNFASSTVLTTLNQSPGANFVNSIVSLGTSVANGSTFLVRLTAANTVSAAGGTVGAAGTFRITNYFSGGVDTGSFQITGSTAAAVPEPSPVILAGAMGMLGLLTRWARRRQAETPA